MSSERRRTHPADVVLETLAALRGLLLPFLIGVVLNAGSGRPVAALAFGAVGVAASAFVGYVRWRSATYALDGEVLSFRSGVFSPDETVVPIARISAVDTVSGPVQRLFGVVELQVQVAGRAEPEVTLRAIDDAEAVRLRAALGHPGAERREPAWRLGPRRALVGALTAPQLGALAPVAGAIGVVVQDLATPEAAGGLLDRAPDTPGEIAAAAAVVLVGAWALSVAAALVVFGRFEVEVDGGRLRIRRGLGRRRTATVPVDRIHALRVVEGPLRQPFGLVAVRMEVAGYGADAGASGALLPVARRDEVADVLARRLPALIGLFWGAPLVARELEAGTHRLVWTQSVTHPLAGGEADRRRRGRDGRRGGLQCGPADRFWTLQWRESGLMLGLTALLALFSVWWLRRRLT